MNTGSRPCISSGEMSMNRLTKPSIHMLRGMAEEGFTPEFDICQTQMIAGTI